MVMTLYTAKVDAYGRTLLRNPASCRTCFLLGRPKRSVITSKRETRRQPVVAHSSLLLPDVSPEANVPKHVADTILEYARAMPTWEVCFRAGVEVAVSVCLAFLVVKAIQKATDRAIYAHHHALSQEKNTTVINSIFRAALVALQNPVAALLPFLAAMHSLRVFALAGEVLLTVGGHRAAIHSRELATILSKLSLFLQSADSITGRLTEVVVIQFVVWFFLAFKEQIVNLVMNTGPDEVLFSPDALQQAEYMCRAVGQKYNMPMELAFDLCTLALYDVAIYADDSTSMKYAEGGERIKDLKAILSRVSEVASLFDDDGLTVRFMNSNLNGNNIKSSAEASSLVDRVKFEGMTPLGTNLDAKIIRPLFTAPLQKGTLPKPILVICITDGEPTGEPENKVVSVIKEAKKMATNSPYGPGSIAFEFAQVGKDQAAQAFLARLDKHPDIGKMIDATSYYELEQEEYKRKGVTLTPDVWLVKLMVGAIDPSFDEQD